METILFHSSKKNSKSIGENGGEEDGTEENELGLAAVFDLISRRYGWSDEYILNLPYRRLFSIMQAISYNEKEEWEKLAFVGWLSGRYEKSFKEFLNELGFFKRYDHKASVEDILKKAKELEKIERVKIDLGRR